MEDGASVESEIGGIRIGWEVAVSQEPTTERLEVDVEGLVVALSESSLHGKLVPVLRPVAVNGTGDSLEAEGNAGGGEVGVQHIKLF